MTTPTRTAVQELVFFQPVAVAIDCNGSAGMHQTVEIAVAAIGSPKTSPNCAIGPIGRLVVMIVLFVSYLQPII